MTGKTIETYKLVPKGEYANMTTTGLSNSVATKLYSSGFFETLSPNDDGSINVTMDTKGKDSIAKFGELFKVQI